jgi:hypothetical protein
METHKPKPVRNWRELLTEIGVIVLSVCIALAAEQVVEWVHWRNQVAEARQVIATELAHDVGSAIIRMRTEPCVERRLDELSEILDAAARTGSLPAVGEIGQPPPRLWNSGAWDSVVASQTATHFPRQQLAVLASIYKIVEKQDESGRAIMEAWSDLHAMVGPGRRLDPASETELRRVLGRARTYYRIYASMASLLIDRVAAQDLPFSQGDLDEIEAARRESLAGGKISVGNPTPMFMACQPLGPTPLHYGQGTSATVPALIEDRLKHLPDFGGH